MKKDKQGGIIGGMTLAGLGTGFLFLDVSPLFFLASILIGLGLGLVIASVVK